MSSDGFLLYALGCATAAYLAVQMLIHLYYALVVGDGIPRSRIELAAAAAGDAEADPSSTSYRGGHGEKHSYSLWRSIAAVAWRFPRDPTITGVRPAAARVALLARALAHPPAPLASPRVPQVIHCDVTQTVEVLERLKTEKGVRVTMTHLAAYGTAMAMKVRRELQSAWRRAVHPLTPRCFHRRTRAQTRASSSTASCSRATWTSFSRSPWAATTCPASRCATWTTSSPRTSPSPCTKR